MLRQACRDVVTSILQRQLQWGPTVIVLGVYSRTMLEQQARACSMLQQYLHNIDPDYR
jgi:hypothetical protein